ncbi:hypothetical protein [Aromatoleum anaerobium]|uniref:Uncharacterized protein n=1 Tax=Aromatoleum anaerobium TaxID=182180 RepID=A0ABX1PJS7_9RHOO|nr:hypothetical protein [Aromatoleum anaerobium]MCK0508548.1 hypothetical protein [Aromatoleum anaerobium]
MQNFPRTVTSLLNRRAHAEGLAYAEVVKRRLVADLARLKANGAKPAELLAFLEGEQGAAAAKPFPFGELRPWCSTRP